MAIRTFKVSKRGVDPIEVRKDLPENLADPLWADVVDDPDSDINDLALQALVVKCQAGARNHLDKGLDAVQRFVDGYKYGARSGGFIAPSISAEDAEAHGFSAEQLAFLRSAGMAIPGLSDGDEDSEADVEAMAEA